MRRVRFAAEMIKAKQPRAAAMTEATKRELMPAEVERVYAAWGPTSDPVHLAQRWLHMNSTAFHPLAKHAEIEALLVNVDCTRRRSPTR